jgi:hypothetical protein
MTALLEQIFDEVRSAWRFRWTAHLVEDLLQ